MRKTLLILLGVCLLLALPYVAVKGERTAKSPAPVLGSLPSAVELAQVRSSSGTGEVTLVEDGKQRKVYRAVQKTMRTLFIEDPEKGYKVRVSGKGDDGAWAVFEPLDAASNVSGEPDGNRMAYTGVFPGVDEEYITEENRLKHNLYLSSQARSTYTYRMRYAQDLRMFVNGNEKTRDFTTSSPIEMKDSKGERHFTLAAPYAFEKGNERNRIDAIYKVQMEEKGLAEISMEIPSAWLATANYPVVLDPSVIYDVGGGNGDPTAYNHQRKIVRGPDGALHFIYHDGDYCMIRHTQSSDNGMTWSYPEMIAYTWDCWAAPSIAVDSENHLHVVWEGYYENMFEYYFLLYREFDGTSWAPVETLEMSEDWPDYRDAAIVADPLGLTTTGPEKVHLVYRTSGNGDAQLFYRSKVLGGSWSTATEINTPEESYDNPSIALDSQNNPHIVCEQWTPAFSDEIFYVYFDGISWSYTASISGNRPDEDERPCIVVDNQDRVNVVWESYDDSVGYDQIWFAQKDGAWSTPVDLSENDEFSARRPAIGADADDNLHVVWYANMSPHDEIFYRRTMSPTWGPIQQLTDNNGFFSGMVTGIDSRSPNIQDVAGPEPFGGPYVVWTDMVQSPQWHMNVWIRYLGGSTVALDPPTLLSPTGYGRRCVTFDWTDVVDPSDVYYTLQVSTDPTFAIIDVVNRNTLMSEYTLSGTGSEVLEDAIIYFWRARARSNSGGESPWAEDTFTADTLAPTTTVSLDTVPGLNGWYYSVQVNLTPDDGSGSGVDQTYQFLAERGLSPVDFDWIEISDDPYLFPGCWAWNQTATNIPLGFTFPFYDSTYDTVSICSNGWLSFTYTGNDNSYSNQFPYSGMNNVIAPLWYQWGTCWENYNVYYRQTSCPNAFVVEWRSVADWWWMQYNTFEAVLYPGGVVQFNYMQVRGSFSGNPETGFNFGDGNVGYNHPSWPTSEMSLGNFEEVPLSFDLPEGDNVVLQVFSSDMAGNRETPSAEMVFMIDGIAPDLAFTNPPVKDYNFNDTLLTVSGTANDPGSSGLDVVEVSTDQGASWDTAVGTTSWSYDWILPGTDTTLTFWAMATDTAGNSILDSVTVHLQLGMPISIITDPVDGDTMSRRTITVSGTATPVADQIIDTVIVIVNGIDTVETTGGTSWSATVNLPNLATDYQIQSFAVGIDTLIPDTLTETPSAGIWVTSPPYPSSVITSPEDGDMLLWPLFTIEGTAMGAETTLAVVEVSTDGGTTWNGATGTDNWTYVWSTDDGSYALLSKATNDLGAAQIDFDTVNVTVDLLAPTSMITDPVDGDTFTIDSTTIYTVMGTASDAGSGVNRVELSVDGGATWNDATGDTSWTFDWTLPESTVTVNLISKATDNVNREETPGAGITVYVIWTGVGVEEITAHRVPVRFALSQNTPNPFARSTRVQYALPRESDVSLRVYDPAGRVVKVLADGREEPGFRFIDWDGRDSSGNELSNGIYFVRLVVDGNRYTDTRKIVLLR